MYTSKHELEWRRWVCESVLWVLYYTSIRTFTFSLPPPHYPQPLASIITSSVSTTSFFFTFHLHSAAAMTPEPSRNALCEMKYGGGVWGVGGAFILLSKSHLLFPSQPGKKEKNERESAWKLPLISHFPWFPCCRHFISKLSYPLRFSLSRNKATRTGERINLWLLKGYDNEIYFFSQGGETKKKKTGYA